MKTKINALVVDDSMEFTSSVKEYFKNNAVIKIVDVVTDGEKKQLITKGAVEEILKYLVENDYQVITVSQMLNAKGYDLTKTRVFYSARQ